LVSLEDVDVFICPVIGRVANSLPEEVECVAAIAATKFRIYAIQRSTSAVVTAAGMVAASDRTALMAGIDVDVSVEIFATSRPTRTSRAMAVLKTVSIDPEKVTIFATHRMGWTVAIAAGIAAVSKRETRTSVVAAVVVWAAINPINGFKIRTSAVAAVTKSVATTTVIGRTTDKSTVIAGEITVEIETVNGRMTKISASAVVEKVDPIAPTNGRRDIIREVFVVVKEELITFTNGRRVFIRGSPGVVPEAIAATNEHFLKIPDWDVEKVEPIAATIGLTAKRSIDAETEVVAAIVTVMGRIDKISVVAAVECPAEMDAVSWRKYQMVSGTFLVENAVSIALVTGRVTRMSTVAALDIAAEIVGASDRTDRISMVEETE